MNQGQQRSIDVLNRCLRLQAEEEEDVTRQQRLDILIADFGICATSQIKFATAWYFCVPEAFRSALDIKFTPRMIEREQTMRWTQGSRFHFEAGDTLYDSPEAYSDWNLEHFQICLDIWKASPAKPAGGPNKSARYPGTVIFDVLTPNSERTQLVKDLHQQVMTQDEFIQLLIVGPPLKWGDLVAPTASQGTHAKAAEDYVHALS